MKPNSKRWRFLFSTSVIYVGIVGAIKEWWYFCLIGVALMEIAWLLFPNKE